MRIVCWYFYFPPKGGEVHDKLVRHEKESKEEIAEDDPKGVSGSYEAVGRSIIIEQKTTQIDSKTVSQ